MRWKLSAPKLTNHEHSCLLNNTMRVTCNAKQAKTSFTLLLSLAERVNISGEFPAGSEPLLHLSVLGVLLKLQSSVYRTKHKQITEVRSKKAVHAYIRAHRLKGTANFKFFLKAKRRDNVVVQLVNKLLLNACFIGHNI